MRQAGFTTGAITENVAILRGRGLERGFDAYRENPAPMPHRIGVQSARTFALALDWLATKRDRDFFLFLHTYEVHEPYEPPEEHRSHFAGTATDHAGASASAQHQALRYDQEIRYLDERLAEIFTGLERLGLAESTLCWTSACAAEACRIFCPRQESCSDLQRSFSLWVFGGSGTSSAKKDQIKTENY